MLRLRARSAACIAPAPPKQTNVKSRGSYPRSNEITRIARSMVALATRRMPSAASLGEIRISAANAFIASRTGSTGSRWCPPKKCSGESRPR